LLWAENLFLKTFSAPPKEVKILPDTAVPAAPEIGQ
jgi:hypothetical protein